MAKKPQIKETVITLDANVIVPFSDIANEIPQEDDFISKLDLKRIEHCEKTLTEAKDRISKKVYAVKFDSKADLDNFFAFMENDAEWKEKESLGVIEICKVINKAKKDGIKQETLYISALPLEASHYFLSKTSGKGLSEAKKFISMLKPFSQSLESVKADAIEIQGLETELSAAQQGLAVS